MRINNYSYAARNNVLTVVLSRILSKKFMIVNRSEREIMSAVASEDFINYYSVLLGIEEFEDAEELAYKYIENMFERSPTEIIAEIDKWIDVWMWKWKQRVKLAMKNEENKSVSKVDIAVNNILLRIKGLKEIKRFAIGSLIRNNEVCFTNLLADNIVKSIIYKFALHIRDEKKVSEILNRNKHIFVNEIVSRVKSLKKFKGQLVIINVSGYVFNEGNNRSLREWWF